MSAEARKLEAAFGEFFEARGRFRLDPEGRAAKHTYWIEPDAGANPGELGVAQMLIDADEQNDWEARFTVLLEESRRENRAVIRFSGVNAVGA